MIPFALVFRFKIDDKYVGIPPQIEITVGNLNDNIDKAFLSDMMNKVGPIDELTIYYHPLTHRHLGFARILFQDVKYAKLCIDKYNGKSVMGKVSDTSILINIGKKKEKSSYKCHK